MKTSISYLFVLTLVAYCVADCPDGFIKHLYSCYLFVRIKATWPEAETYCHAIGADFASIEKPDEQHFLESHLESVTGAYNPPRFWIGGNDFGEEGTWVWTQTNARINDQEYKNWRHGDSVPSADADEHCLDISHRYNWEWNDNECDTHFFFICEKSAFKEGVDVIIG